MDDLELLKAVRDGKAILVGYEDYQRISEPKEIMEHCERMVRNAAKRARKKKYKIDFDAAYLFGLWQKNDGRCAISNMPFMKRNRSGKNVNNPYWPSIDRKKAGLYKKGNVQITTFFINIAKNEFDEDTIYGACTQYYVSDIINRDADTAARLIKNLESLWAQANANKITDLIRDLRLNGRIDDSNRIFDDFIRVIGPFA